MGEVGRRRGRQGATPTAAQGPFGGQPAQGLPVPQRLGQVFIVIQLRLGAVAMRGPASVDLQAVRSGGVVPLNTQPEVSHGVLADGLAAPLDIAVAHGVGFVSHAQGHIG